MLCTSMLEEDLENIISADIDFKKLNDRVVLVTGATGLIGIAIVRTLFALRKRKNINCTILAMVRNYDKAKQIFENYLDDKNLKIIVADISDRFEITAPVDYIFHCASVTASKIMVSQPVETIMTSVIGTRNILELATIKNTKSIVYLSSMEMYGAVKENYLDVKEDNVGFIDPLNVRSNYPESKRLCENMCVAYAKEFDVPVKIARLAQTFGAGILPSENRVFAQFARSAIYNRNIVLHTKGLSEGNYCYTRDTVKGLFTILFKGNNGEAYNVSNPEAHTTIVDMARMVCEKIAKGNIKVVFDIPESNMYGYAADTKLKLNSDKLQSLGWKPEIGLEEAYRRMIFDMKCDFME